MPDAVLKELAALQNLSSLELRPFEVTDQTLAVLR